MRKSRLIISFLVVLAAGVASAFGGGHRSDCDCGPPCPSPPPCPVEKTRTLYEVKVLKKDITVLVEQRVPREIVTREKCVEMVPVWTEQKKCVTVCKQVPRLGEKEVLCSRLVAECVTDPCTGCPKTCYRPTVCIRKVPCTVYDCVAETREIVEKVCCMKAQEKVVEKRCRVTEIVQVPRRETVRFVTLVPISTMELAIPVPVVPSPHCPPPRCDGCGH